MTAVSRGDPRTIRVGTCSWADRSMVEAWYPRETRGPEGLLRYYARHFDTVEVDATFYALPTPERAARWAQRTPEGFLFHVKAFGMMTGHRVPSGRLPADMRGAAAGGDAPDPGIIQEAFARFMEGIDPLRAAGKLGAILLQYPPSFRSDDPVSWRRNMAWIGRSREILGEREAVVEFRHRSWYQEATLRATRRHLARWGLGLVTVDEPQAGPGSIPTVVAPTSGTGYVRLHGRNVANWNRRVPSAAERFRYDYADSELAELLGPIRSLAERTQRTFVMFNNCYADYAARNALRLRTMLEEGEHSKEGSGRPDG